MPDGPLTLDRWEQWARIMIGRDPGTIRPLPMADLIDLAECYLDNRHRVDVLAGLVVKQWRHGDQEVN